MTPAPSGAYSASAEQPVTNNPTRNQPLLNVLSLFAGIGGLELGLERAGMTVVGQVERDPYCQQVLAEHWPEVPKHDDVRTAVAWWRGAVRPPVHVVAGGFPCQPFSSAGLRRGVDDERWLWPAMRTVVGEVRPRYVVVENVAALLRDSDAFGTVLADLHDLGFDAEWSVVPACALAAPHTRERLLLVAYPAGDHVPDQGAGQASPRGLRREPGRGRRGLRRGIDWLPEPALDRVADGVPLGLVRDPLHALGNAVVPAVGQLAGELVMAREVAA
jgi:DNA (cytosine-5)-methyltransferase 1